jgi:hypothetical protein
MTSRIGNVLADRLTGAGLDRASAGRLSGAKEYVAQGVAPVPKGTPEPAAHAITTGSHLAFMDGFHSALIVGAVVALVAAGVALLVRRGQKPVEGALVAV